MRIGGRQGWGEGVVVPSLAALDAAGALPLAGSSVRGVVEIERPRSLAVGAEEVGAS